jgi:hypothetical protein
MRRNPLYVFQNRDATGIYDVPLESMVQIIDSDGNGTPQLLQLIDKTGLHNSSTIGQFLDNTSSHIDVDNVTAVNGQVGNVTLTTDDITEGLANLYYTDSRVDTRADARFDVKLASKTTDDLSEGTLNEYYTAAKASAVADTRFGVNFGAKTTDDLPQGITNQYYTEAKATANFNANLAANTTDSLGEGNTNKYYTDARADARVDAGFAAKTTDALTEGSTNKYYSDARGTSNFNTNFALKTADDLAEGSTNLYYTDAKADARVDAGFVAKSTDNLDEGATNKYYTDARADARVDAGFAAKTTDALTEGSTNKYYSDALVEAKLNATSVNSLSDVDTSSQAPTGGQTLTWSGNYWVPTTYTTDDIGEGSNNLYYTDARARAAASQEISVTGVTSLADVDTSGAVSGQTLKWDGTNWVPSDDIDTIYTAGTGLSLTGTAFALDSGVDGLSDVDTTTTAPTNGQTLKWDGTNWAPADDIDTNYTAGTGLSLTGTEFALASGIDGLSDVDTTTTAPTNGQTLKWDGTNWAPADDIDTDTTYTAGTGLSLTGTEFTLADEAYTSAEKTKLAGIEDSAQVNAVAVDPGDSTATDVAGIVADYNTLLGNLRTAGIIA